MGALPGQYEPVWLLTTQCATPITWDSKRAGPWARDKRREHATLPMKRAAARPSPMRRVLILGSGKIGRMVAKLLSECGDYDVVVADHDRASLARLERRLPKVRQEVIDASDEALVAARLEGASAVISALPYRWGAPVARAALARGVSYFDLTEDVATAREIRALAAGARPGQVFMPQCGLAPGFVSIAASDLCRRFDALESVSMRVGALPQFPSNELKYNLTWSTVGLINEYCNPCEAIVDGQAREVLPLEGLEHFSLDGVRYEAFNTSGGAGTLCETLLGKVRQLDYKTIRYVGHRDLAAFLVRGLRLGERRELLIDILEHAIPITFQDVVIVFCTVTGHRRGQLVQLTDARKIYAQTLGGEVWSAIQISTASAVAAVLDLSLGGQLPSRGFVAQEQIPLDAFLANRFGRYYDSTIASRFVFGDLTEEEKEDAG